LLPPSQLPSAHCLFKSHTKRSNTPFCPQTPRRVFLGCNAWEGLLLGLGCTATLPLALAQPFLSLTSISLAGHPLA
jgi:hypothetical protein